jgi:hypothetical protein
MVRLVRGIHELSDHCLRVRRQNRDAAGSLLGNSLINWSGLADDEMKKSKQNAQSLLASFDDLTEQLGVPHEAIHEHELVGETPNLMAEYARLRDLTIIPVPAGDYVDQWYAETVVFQSGRPVLIVPETISAEFKLDAVAVAWDFSRTAARAISDAIPFLERARARCAFIATRGHRRRRRSRRWWKTHRRRTDAIRGSQQD